MDRNGSSGISSATECHYFYDVALCDKLTKEICYHKLGYKMISLPLFNKQPEELKKVINRWKICNKDKSRKVIWNTIVSVFGIDYSRIVDFWDADNFAIGILRGDKLIYVSTWDMNNESSAEILCYVEFDRENGNNDIPYLLMKKNTKNIC